MRTTGAVDAIGSALSFRVVIRALLRTFPGNGLSIPSSEEPDVHCESDGEEGAKHSVEDKIGPVTWMSQEACRVKGCS